MITAFGVVDIAVQALKLGAYDFIETPINFEKLENVIRNALETNRLETQVAQTSKSNKSRFGLENIVGKSKAIREVLELINRLAQAGASTLLVQGESGTGKDLVSRALHYESTRRDNPFFALNCAAIPETLIETELFGYEKGAFTDAKTMKKGVFEMANGGTVFLDEISEMHINMQSKFLRVLEDQTFRRVGGVRDISVNVQVVASTTSVIRDITERHRAAEALRKAHDELEIRVQERTAELLKANAEKQQVLEQLLRAENLAEIGQLAAGVAHEIRNPLAGIRGAIKVLRENKMDSELQRPIMTEILERVDRLNMAVQDLLEYAKPMSLQKTKLQLSDVLDSTLSALLHDPRLQSVEILKDYRQSVDVETDVAIIERVFINIILNAAQAMNSSGKLQITLEGSDAAGVVSFQDTGPGIEPGILEKIFNPFFTTRSEGSGLGLALCKKYIEVLGGKIEVTTQLGVGTTFVISLPKASAPSFSKEELQGSPG